MINKLRQQLLHYFVYFTISQQKVYNLINLTDYELLIINFFHSYVLFFFFMKLCQTIAMIILKNHYNLFCYY